MACLQEMSVVSGCSVAVHCVAMDLSAKYQDNAVSCKPKMVYLQVALLLCCLIHWPLCKCSNSSTTDSSAFVMLATSVADALQAQKHCEC